MYDDSAYHGSVYFNQSSRKGASPELHIYAQGLERLRTAQAIRRGSGRLLDLGCGNGTFLMQAAEQGWQTEGIELSQGMAELARARSSAEIQCGDFLDIEPLQESYQAIAMWDFLEHVRDPERVLAKASTLLAPGGYIVIFTINSASLFNGIAHALERTGVGIATRPLELLYDARHNFYYNEDSLDRLLNSCHLEVTERHSYRAYLGRWLSEPAPWWMRLGGDLVDLLSTLTGSRYRQLVYCTRG